ncbi:MAG: hypothetical protein L6435_08775 [Anaerolineae bacterium]|nr:hypothetical protein [Anaerolineae bacterium]
MSRWLKVAFFAVLLIGAGYFFGTICKQVGEAYQLVLSPSKELLNLLLWFLLAAGAMSVTAGLVASLLRPVGAAAIAFALSGLAMLLGWKVQVALSSGILMAAYLAAAFLYAGGVATELNERVRFSVRPISDGQGTLLMALILVACGSLYLGYAPHIEREGFSVPDFYIETFMQQMEKQIEARVPAEQRQEVVAGFREEFGRAIDGFFERTLKPYERFIPLFIAASLFMPLLTITRLLAWVPTLSLSLLFPLLKGLGVVSVVTETREVQRLVID